MANGIEFPVGPNGKVSTRAFGQRVLSEPLQVLNPELSRSIQNETKWRQKYGRFLPEYQLTCSASAAVAETVARESLRLCHGLFRFHRDGVDMPLNQAMNTYDKPAFYTGTVSGGAEFSGSISVIYGNEKLTASGLKTLLHHWIKKGVIEHSHGSDVEYLLDDANLLDLRGQTFVVLGGTSEVGPLKTLLQLGANVVAVSRPNKTKWRRLMEYAASTCGTLIFPCHKKPEGDSITSLAAIAGADLMTQTPELAHWLSQVEGDFTLGCYAYLDGADHVRVSMAMDAIAYYLLSRRQDVRLAYLLTPSDVYSVSDEITQANEHKLKRLSLSAITATLVNSLTFGRWFSPSIVAKTKTKQDGVLGILDNLVTQQGPNYVIAKRIQRWRAIDCASKGIPVSCNVAPAASTESVMSNPFFLAASNGSESFGVEVFTPNMVNTLMTLQMIQDIQIHGISKVKGERLFERGANHGGAWRIGYQFRSLMVMSLLVGVVGKIIPLKKIFIRNRSSHAVRLRTSN